MQLFNKARPRGGLSGLGESLPQSETADVMAQIVGVISTAQQWQSYRELQELNIERARMGLPPLDVASYQTGVSVGLDPATKDFLKIGAGVAVAVLLAMNAPKILRAVKGR